MRRTDALSLEFPFYGSRQMARHLRRGVVSVGAASGPSADACDGPGSNLREAAYERRVAGSPVYPYLLRGLTIDGPDQVGARTSSATKRSPTVR